MATICPGCNLAVEPIKLFDRSKTTGKPYLLTKCPRERCGFFIDIEDYTGKAVPPANKKKSSEDDSRRTFWRYGL